MNVKRSSPLPKSEPTAQSLRPTRRDFIQLTVVRFGSRDGAPTLAVPAQDHGAEAVSANGNNVFCRDRLHAVERYAGCVRQGPFGCRSSESPRIATSNQSHRRKHSIPPPRRRSSKRPRHRRAGQRLRMMGSKWASRSCRHNGNWSIRRSPRCRSEPAQRHRRVRLARSHR